MRNIDQDYKSKPGSAPALRLAPGEARNLRRFAAVCTFLLQTEPNRSEITTMQDSPALTNATKVENNSSVFEETDPDLRRRINRAIVDRAPPTYKGVYAKFKVVNWRGRNRGLLVDLRACVEPRRLHRGTDCTRHG